MDIHKSASATSRIDHLIEFCVVIYITTLFTRWGELPTAAAWVGALAWLFGAHKPYLASFFRDRLALVWLSLLIWALASVLWSTERIATLAAWYTSFDDHLLVVPLLVHLCATGRTERLAKVFAWAALVIIALNGLHYLNDILKGIFDVANNWARHRKWAYPLVIFAPFLMARIVLAHGRGRLLWGAALLATVLMVLATGARGAWLALAVAVAVFGGWKLRGERRRTVLLTLAVLVLALPLFLLLPQGTVVKQRLAQGFDTSARVTGTWGPALEMTMQRPLLGYGLGMRAYHDEYQRQKDAHPHWYFRDKSMSPHNFFLMALFGLGLPGLLLTLLLTFQIASRFFARARAAAPGHETLLPLALFASFVAHYVVRGSFETLSWKPMTLYVGLAVGLSLVAKGRGAR